MNIDSMDGLIKTLQQIRSTFDESLEIGILVASINVSNSMSAVAAIKTLNEKGIKWEHVSSRFIEETNNMKSSGQQIRAKKAN